MKRFFSLSLILFFLFSLTSCEVVGDIFEASVWVGILAVVTVVGLLFFLFRGKK